MKHPRTILIDIPCMPDHPLRIAGVPASFWVVLHPTPNSELGDILYKSNFVNICLQAQAQGGLTYSELAGVYGNVEKSHAVKHAKKLLAQKKQDVERIESA